MLAAYLHNLDPFALRITGNFGIRWYGVSYVAGFFVAYLLVRRVTRVAVSSLKPEHVLDLVVAVAIGIMLGGRLGYVLFYDRSLFWSFSSDIPFWGVLAINKGGMASHGGMIGGILGAAYFAKRHGHSAGFLLDLAAFGAPMGIFFGRVANFINGELYGRPCTSDFSLAVKFPQEILSWTGGDGQPVNPNLQLLQPALDALTPSSSGGGAGASALLGDGDSLHRIVEAVQRGNQQVIQIVEPLLTPRHPSQLYEAMMEGLVMMAVMLIVWWRPRKPGVLVGWFGLVYGILRIIGEQFRTPDAQIANQEFARWGITRGQWLSALLALAGLVVILIASKRKVEPVGGWRKR